MSMESNSDTHIIPGPGLSVSAANDDLQQAADMRPRSPAETLEPSRAPEPPEFREKRRTHPIIRFMNGIMTLLVLGVLGSGAFIYFAKTSFDLPGPLKHSTVIVIPKGHGLSDIALRLEREGIISNRILFSLTSRYFGAGDKLKAGEYEIRKNASMRDVLDQLVRGKAILHKVSIPEGLTSVQAMERLIAAPLLVGEITRIPAEGTLLPDTYKFSRGMTRQELIERMQAEQRKFIKNLWDNRDPDLPFKTPEEAIIMASIVEKETGRADERSRIAGVFINRLRKGMRLQSDPTIIYGLVGGKGTLGRPLLKAELQKETPYNTYKIDGLPPGPIANPGRAAIEAVLNPAKTNDLFFVADGTGGHAFAPSLAGHNRNVAQWRQVEREMRAREKEEALKKEQRKLQAPSGAGATEQALVPGEQGSPATALDLSLNGLPGLSIGGGFNQPVFGVPQTSPALAPQAPAASPAPPVIAGGDPTTVPLPKRNPRIR